MPVLGSCPYDECSGALFLGEPDAPFPVFQKHECNECGNVIWTKFSRINPCSWTEEGFKKEFEVDEKSKSIKEKT